MNGGLPDPTRSIETQNEIPCPGRAVNFFKEFMSPSTFTGNCICSDCLHFSGQYSGTFCCFYIQTENRTLNRTFHLERSKDKCFPTNCAKNPLGVQLESAGSSPFQMFPTEWISPSLTPRPHSLLCPFAPRAHKGLSLYTICLPHPTSKQLPEAGPPYWLSQAQMLNE